MIKYKINLNSGVITKIIIILELLNKNTNNQTYAPLNIIINQILFIFSDGKLDTHDIPMLVKVATECLNLNIKTGVIKELTIDDIGALIKIIIIGLIESKIININSNDEQIIIKLIDGSLILLNTTIEIVKITPKWLCCF